MVDFLGCGRKRNESTVGWLRKDITMGGSGAGKKKVHSQKTSDEKPKQGGKVKRKQLPSVPDLLSNGPDEGR